MNKIPIAFLAVFLTLLNVFSQVNSDLYLEENVYCPEISWFSNKNDFINNQKLYSNGQKFLDYIFSSDSLPIYYSTFFSNGDTAMTCLALSINRTTDSINQANFYLQVEYIEKTFYKNSQLRSIYVDKIGIESYEIYDLRGRVKYKGDANGGFFHEGIFPTGYTKTGVYFSYFKKGKLVYLIYTDLLNVICEVRNSKNKLIKSKRRKLFFENYLKELYDRCGNG